MGEGFRSQRPAFLESTTPSASGLGCEESTCSEKSFASFEGSPLLKENFEKLSFPQ